VEISELQDIRPGLTVDIVVATDYSKEVTDVRRAVIYEVEGNNFILSQTRPPLSRFYLNRGVVLSYLVAGDPGPVRVGVFCQLTNIIPYTLASSEKVHAVVMALKSGAELQNLRMHLRMKTRSNQNMSISIEGQLMKLIDISVGGAMLSHQGFLRAKPLENVKIDMVIDGEPFQAEAKVVRIWTPYMDRQQRDLEYITIQFLGLNRRLNYLLGGKIFNMERDSRGKA
jgi:hypothetical protein